MGNASAWGQLRDFFGDDPLLAASIAAALVALATTPIAFAVLGRLEWFQARRGRTMLRPTFASIVVGMMLVMGIPAIFAALLVKSRSFDKSRYEFDPNQTITVVDQGRQYESVTKLDEAVRDEMKRLAEEKKNLVENVKKLDRSMLALRAVAGTSPAVAQAIPDVLQSLAGVRKSVGVDAPQQLMDFTAPPVDLAGAIPAPVAVANVPAAAPAAPAGNGLSPPEIAAEMAVVPEPQKALAALLPLKDLPAGWVVGKGMGPSGKSRLETFNADNLFEKINGRAESFVQYGVKGMAYTFYHPVGDEASEAQLYVFEMGDSLKALGKYGSEKPEGVKALPIGSEGYASAGSAFFYAGPYYVQIVSNRDDPKVADFSLDLAKRIAAQIKGEPASPGASSAPTAGAVAEIRATTDPGDLLGLLPDGPEKANPKYVPQDVFGYSFLTDVFLADYTRDGVTFQGFLRAYPSAEEAKALFEKYVASAEQDGAKIQEVPDSGADRMVVAANADLGLTDVIFFKGNAVAGANGVTKVEPGEAFAKAFAKALPTKIPFIEKTTTAEGAGGEDKGSN